MGNVRAIAYGLVSLLLTASLSGCFGEEEEVVEEVNVFDALCEGSGGLISNTTWYHYSNATDATKTSDVLNGSSVLVGNNAPVCAIGTYYGIGMTTFEPTSGVTSSDNLYMTSWGTGRRVPRRSCGARA